MPRRNTTTPFLKSCIIQSLLQLLKNQPIDTISIQEIVKQAGVSRSTYYRHFNSKQNVVQCFFTRLLDQHLDSIRNTPATVEEYFTAIFILFLSHRDELLILHMRGLSDLLLDAMNNRFISRKQRKSLCSEELYLYYHIGGVFNAYQLWIQDEMKTPPHELAALCVAILPDDFFPLFLKNVTHQDSAIM